MAKNSFFLKKPIHCPVCEHEFQREVLRTGQGRLISLFMRPDLRRVYKFSEKYGEILPLIYNAVVCPKCYFATLNEDFEKKDHLNIEEAKANTIIRKDLAKELFPDLSIDFNKERDLYHGLLSFFLAANGYNFFNGSGYTSAKKGFSFLRGAWCCLDIDEKENDKGFDKLAIHFRYQAFLAYRQALKSMYEAKGRFGEITHYGPDLDTNYGYNGFIYVHCYHSIYFLPLLSNAVDKYKELNSAQIYLSKVFGFGKSSRDKPSPLLDAAKDLYDSIREELQKLKDDPTVSTKLDQLEEQEEQKGKEGETKEELKI